MELGYFTMPSHPPERPLRDGHEWDLQVLRWLDELGYAECWIGEHHTAPWEPHPAPDLLIAQALLQTKNIRIGPGGFLLPYHHPAELANRVAMLDHISSGRLMFGVAASGLPSDWEMFNVDGSSGQNREMTREALDIIEEDDPVFIVNSFSKSWAMTGWRMGWLIYPRGLAPTFEKMIQFNTSGGQAFLQYGGVAAVRDGEAFVAQFVERCRAGRETINAALAKMNRVKNIPNSGSFYAMFEVDGVTDTLGFCKKAVTEARVGLAPGVAFGKGGERMIRLCYAKGADTLNEAADRLGKFIAAL